MPNKYVTPAFVIVIIAFVTLFGVVIHFANDRTSTLESQDIERHNGTLALQVENENLKNTN